VPNAVFLAALALADVASAQPIARVDERIGAKVPAAPLIDEHGRIADLDAALGRRPAVLVFVYYRCSVLCDRVLSGVVGTLSQIEWTAGREFDVAVVSIDPDDTPAESRARRDEALEAYGRGEAFRFFTADAAAIADLTDATGYRFGPDGRGGFRHPAVVVFLTPERRVSSYLYGLELASDDVADALRAASEERTRPTLERFVIACFGADANGDLDLVMVAVRAVPALAAIALGTMLVSIFVRERRRRRRG
jgi:protein SCO1/2